jgi:hypothetical protein
MTANTTMRGLRTTDRPSTMSAATPNNTFAAVGIAAILLKMELNTWCPLVVMCFLESASTFLSPDGEYDTDLAILIQADSAPKLLIWCGHN